MRKKAIIIISVVLSAFAVCILSVQAFTSFFQGYRKVVVSEGQVSTEDFGSENSPKTISFIKEGKNLNVITGLPLRDTITYQTADVAVYHVNGFKIIVSETYEDWLVVWVKAEWQ